MLTPRKRRFLYDEIQSLAESVKCYKIGNEEINAAMRGKMSLNELEALNFARLIDSLETEPDRIYLDSPDVVSERFGIRVSLFSRRKMRVHGVKTEKRPKGMEDEKRITVIAEHKADIRYPIVSSASIIAKVERDAEIERITDRLGIDIGSGYPSDKVTMDALREHLQSRRVSPFIREKWKTLEIIRQMKISDFMGKAP